MKTNIQRIEFFNREKEKEEILNILRTEPQLINFIYGPINSGKTALIQKLINELPKERYTIFYINLRGKSIVKYMDFVRVLFTIEEKGFLEKIKDIFKHIASTGEKAAYKYTGIPVDRGLLETFFKEKSNEDVFSYLEEYFKGIAKHKTPVLIIDELQVIGDLEIDGKLIYKLFNFFIRLTKEIHVCHIFALSSDSLFIEKVYNEAMLQGRCNYLFVDDFDEQTTKKFLKKYNFTEEEQKIAWNYFGGKPSYLLYVVLSKRSNKNIIEVINEKINEKVMYLRNMLDELLYISPEVKIGGKESIVNREKLIELLKKFKDHEKIEDEGISRAEKIYFINKNILFLDTKKGIIKPQSRLDTGN